MMDDVRKGRSAEGCPLSVEWSNGRITAVSDDGDGSRLILPAFVDIQINGYMGININSATVTPDDLLMMAREIWATGVGTFYPTVTTGSRERMDRSIRTIREAMKQDADFAASVGGIHVEGPYISPDDGPRGAHAKVHVRPPDWDEFCEWQQNAEGSVRMLTLSPEWDNAADVIEKVAASGVVVAIGHTKATTEQLDAAVKAGAKTSTHLGNGAHATLPRHPNYIWEQLGDDRLWASFIADGSHLPPKTLRSMTRAKTLDRAIFTSDAVWLAGMPPGEYEGEDGQSLEMQPTGRVNLGGTPYLAGAGLPLVRGVENGVRHAGLTLSESVRLATINPAELMGIPETVSLESDASANLVVAEWDEGERAMRIVETIIDGKTVYRSESEQESFA